MPKDVKDVACDLALGPVNRAAGCSWLEAAVNTGSPILAMAPMVGQSDYPFRKLVRLHGATLCYTEMWMASQFHSSERYRIQALGKCGVRDDDHPLIVQLAANNPDDFAKAALAAQNLGADGVDLNLGCPQRRVSQYRLSLGLGIGFRVRVSVGSVSIDSPAPPHFVRAT